MGRTSYNKVYYPFTLQYKYRYEIETPRNAGSGPPKWMFESKKYQRENVLAQNSSVYDKGQFSEPTMAIIKGKIVKKSAIIDVQFLAKDAGYVGVIFKFVDNKNYYTFEIGGGDDVSKRFFQIRKKIDGFFSVIKRVNTIEELSSVPFFGYEPNNWYHIRILLQDNNISISAALLGTTILEKIMEIQDDSIISGRVGFSTHQTQAVFSEITIVPIPIPSSNYLNLLLIK